MSPFSLEIKIARSKSDFSYDSEVPPSKTPTLDAIREYILADYRNAFAETSWRKIFFEAMVGEEVAVLYYSVYECNLSQEMIDRTTCYFLYNSIIWPLVPMLPFTLDEICYVLENRNSTEFGLLKRWFLEDRFVASLRNHFDQKLIDQESSNLILSGQHNDSVDRLR